MEFAKLKSITPVLNEDIFQNNEEITAKTYLKNIKIIKKSGKYEPWNYDKIIRAVDSAAERAHYVMTPTDEKKLLISLYEKILASNLTEISVADIHDMVEKSLDNIVPEVSEEYRNYRNYKVNFTEMMNSVLKTSDDLNYHVDRSNANTTSTLVSSKRSLIYTALNKEIYKNMFLTKEERSAIDEGEIYIHDLGARLDCPNCCLFDMGKVLQGGFEWEHIGYNEPKDVSTAGRLISDITLNCAAQQYGLTNNLPY